mmetsp:Transcript_2142/g.8398  ORF Transcript_2142/g.8398 Transcript_2142/m.8398 type:complete len:204 (-) Transcript_2142:662-1273(-)
MAALPKYMSGRPVRPPRPLTTVTCSNGAPFGRSHRSAKASHECALNASLSFVAPDASRRARMFSSLMLTIIRFPAGKRKKSGTSVRPANSAFASIAPELMLSNPSSESIARMSSTDISASGCATSERSNTGSPHGCASLFAAFAHVTKNSINPCPSLTACDMHTPNTLPPPAHCVTLAVNTGASPSIKSIQGAKSKNRRVASA